MGSTSQRAAVQSTTSHVDSLSQRLVNPELLVLENSDSRDEGSDGRSPSHKRRIDRNGCKSELIRKYAASNWQHFQQSLLRCYSIIDTQQKRFGLISPSILKQIISTVNLNCFSTAHRRQLSLQLNDYMEECLKQTLVDNSIHRDFFKKFGEKILTIQTNAIFQTKNSLRILQYLMKATENENCFLDLKFELQITETLALANKIKKLSEIDSRAFLFLVIYLWRSCCNLEKKGKNVAEIQKILQIALSKILNIANQGSLGQTFSAINEQIEQTITEQEEKIKEKIASYSYLPAPRQKESLQQFIRQKIQEINEKRQDISSKLILIIKEKNENSDYLRSVIKELYEMNKGQKIQKYTVQRFRKEHSSEKLTLQDYLIAEKDYLEVIAHQTLENMRKPVQIQVNYIIREDYTANSAEKLRQLAEIVIEELKIAELVHIQQILIDIKVKDIQSANQARCEEKDLMKRSHFDRVSYIAKSDMYSPIKALHVFLQGPIKYELFQISEYFFSANSSFTHRQQQALFDHQVTFKSLQQKYDTFLKFIVVVELDTIKIGLNWEKQLDKYQKLPASEVLLKDETDRILKNCGECLQAMHKYEQAMKYYEKYIEFIDENATKTPQQQIERSYAYRMMGDIAQFKQRYSEALAFYEKGASNNLQDPGWQQQKSLIFNNMGIVYDSLKKDKEAYHFLTKCLQIQQNLKGKDSVDSAMALNNLGSLFKRQKKYQQSLQYYKKSLKIKQIFHGKESLQTAMNLNNIGSVYRKLNKFKQALNYYEHCLKIQETAKGKGSIECAVTLNNIGCLYSVQKKYAEAMACYSRTLEIQARVKGKQALECAGTLINLGTLLEKQEKYAEAITKFIDAKKIFIRFLGPKHEKVKTTEQYIEQNRKKI